MALIICPECGNSISEHAPICPHCGFPKKTTRTDFRDPPRKLTLKEKIFIIAIAAGLLLFYAWACGRLFH